MIYEDATAGSLAKRIVSNSLVPAQLAHDPLWREQLADARTSDSAGKT